MYSSNVGLLYENKAMQKLNGCKGLSKINLFFLNLVW